MALLRRVLGETLRGQRVRQQRTLRDVSSEARVSLGYLSEVERGQKEASSELLSAICEALGVRLSEVMHEVSEILRRGETPRRTVPAIPTAPTQPRELVGVGTASGRRLPDGALPDGVAPFSPDISPDTKFIADGADRDAAAGASDMSDSKHQIVERSDAGQGPASGSGEGQLTSCSDLDSFERGNDEFTIDPVIFDAELATVTEACARAIAVA